MIECQSQFVAALTRTEAPSDGTLVKICGITSVGDAVCAAELGADAIGLIFAESPRRIDTETARQIALALPRSVAIVGVFRDSESSMINESIRRIGLHAAQLHGEEPPATCAAIDAPVIKRFDVTDRDDASTVEQRMRPYAVAARLLDPGAGDGRAFDWAIAKGLGDRLILAGGLNANNVASAIDTTSPFAVDVCSGVEQCPGLKDRAKVAAFIQEVRRHDSNADRD